MLRHKRAVSGGRVSSPPARPSRPVRRDRETQPGPAGARVLPPFLRHRRERRQSGAAAGRADERLRDPKATAARSSSTSTSATRSCTTSSSASTRRSSRPSSAKTSTTLRRPWTKSSTTSKPRPTYAPLQGVRGAPVSTSDGRRARQVDRGAARGIDGLEKRKGLDDHWIEVNRLENEGDRLYRDAVAELFDGDMKCTDIIKWKDIYATLEAAIDHVRTSRTFSRPSCSRTPDAPADRHCRGRAGLRLHERLPRFGQRHRHLGLDARPVATGRPRSWPRCSTWWARSSGRTWPQTVGKGIVTLAGRLADRRARGADRRHRLEPHHLVLRHSVELVARADRRPGGRHARGRRHQRGRLERPLATRSSSPWSPRRRSACWAPF